MSKMSKIRKKIREQQSVFDNLLQTHMADKIEQDFKAQSQSFANTNNDLTITTAGSTSGNFTFPAQNIYTHTNPNVQPGSMIPYTNITVPEKQFSPQPSNHISMHESKDGFKWLDDEHTWALAPKTSDIFGSDFLDIFGSSTHSKSTLKDLMKLFNDTSTKTYELFHRHDDDILYEQFQLSERFHGAHAYICKECHKPAPEPYKMLYVLQNSLKDQK